MRGKLSRTKKKIVFYTRTCASRHQKGFRDLLWRFTASVRMHTCNTLIVYNSNHSYCLIITVANHNYSNFPWPNSAIDPIITMVVGIKKSNVTNGPCSSWIQTSPTPFELKTLLRSIAFQWILKMVACPKSTQIKIPKRRDNSTSIKMQMLVMIKPLQITREIILSIFEYPN